MRFIIGFYILLISFCTANAQVSGQNVNKIRAIPKFLKTSYFRNISYWAYSKPKEQNALNNPNLSDKEMKDPLKVILAHLAATDTSLIAKLYQGKGNTKLSTEQISFRQSKEFKKNFLFEVWIEFWFSLEGKNYKAFVVRHQTNPNAYAVLPYICEQVGEQWKITTKKQIAELSFFLLIDPLHFERFLNGAFDLKAVNEDYNKYVYKQTFRVDQGYSMTSLLGRLMGGGGIVQNQINSIGDLVNQDYNFSYQGNTKVGISYLNSIQEGTLVEYNPNKYVFKNHPQFETSMKESPEKAAASWMFMKDNKDKEKYSILAPKMEHLLNEEYFKKSEFGEIEIFRKINFDCEGVEYAVVYFVNWESIKEGTLIRFKDLGKYRLLLKWQDGKWLVDFNPTPIVRRFVWLMEELKAPVILDYCNGESLREDISIYKKLDFCTKEYLDVNGVYWSMNNYLFEVPNNLLGNFSIKNELPEIFLSPLDERKTFDYSKEK